MKIWIYIASFLAAIAISHAAVVVGAPYLIMGVAIKKVSRGGTEVNHFVFGPRTTEASRQIVRPSPDLAYATCAFDLSHGPVHVSAKPWDDYMSISVFQANGDNIYAVNDRQAPQGVDFILARRGQATPAGKLVVISPTDRGIILDRRLTPTQQRFALADEVRRSDQCVPLN